MLRWDAVVEFQIVLAVVYCCIIAICELHFGGTTAAQGYTHHTSSTTQFQATATCAAPSEQSEAGVRLQRKNTMF